MSLLSIVWPMLAVPASSKGWARDGHALFDAARLQLQVDDDAVADAERDVFADGPFEPAERGLHGVGAGQQVEGGELAGLVGGEIDRRRWWPC